MGSTPKYALPYPEQSDPPDGPAQIKALADKLDPIILTPSVFDAKGDLLVGSADDVMARLARGTDGNVLTADAASALGLKWAPPTGGGGGTQLSAAVVGELAYAQSTASVTVTATTEATANTIVTAPAVSFDGATDVVVSFFAMNIAPPVSAWVVLVLFEDGNAIGQIGSQTYGTVGGSSPVFVSRRLRPSAGNHTYSVRAFITSGSSGVVGAGTAGAGQSVPMFIRISRADSAANVGVSGPSPAARVYHSSDQTVASGGSGVALAFNSERFDTDNVHDPATNTSRLTCKTAGRYAVYGHVSWQASATGTERDLWVRLNGTTTVAHDIRTPPGTAPVRQSVATLVDLNVGDYLELYVFHDATASLAITALPQLSPEFAMARVADVGGGLTVGIGTTLPASPFDGQEFVLVDSLTNPSYQWRFRYHAGSTSAYKWEFLGGPPLVVAISTQETTTVAGSWANVATVGPLVNIPRTGEYEVRTAVQATDSAVQQFVQAGVGIGDFSTAIFGLADPLAGIGVAGQWATLVGLGVAVGAGNLTAGQELRLKYFQAGAGTLTVRNRQLFLVPKRVA